jgi:hypothetical protein
MLRQNTLTVPTLKKIIIINNNNNNNNNKNNFEKISIFGLFGENRLWSPQVGGSILWQMVIFWLPYIKIGLDYEFDIKNNI